MDDEDKYMTDNSTITDNSAITDNPAITDNSAIIDSSDVTDNPAITDNSAIIDRSTITDSTVSDNSSVTDSTNTDNSAVTETVESEANCSVQLDIAEIKMIDNVEVNQENKKLITASESEPVSVVAEELKKAEEPEKIEMVSDKTSEEIDKVNEAAQIEGNTFSGTLPINDLVQQDNLVEQPSLVSNQLIISSDNLIESAIPSQDSLIELVQDQIIPVQENVIAGNQQQVIPITESIPINTIIKLEDNGVDLDQQSVLSMKDAELKDLVMRELAEFLTDEPSQNVSPALLEMKSEHYIKNYEETKIGNFEHTLSEVNKMGMKDEKKSKNDISDALSMLATGVLNHAPPTNGTVDVATTKPTEPPIEQVKQEGPVWCDVGVIKGTTCLVKQFYSTSITDEHENTSLDNLPDYTNKLKIDIQPGTVYKLRIAAINTCGRGEWSEISTFKTCVPGYPGAPTAVKITKAPNGASLTWEALPTCSGKILEYSVCLAIKNPKEIPPQNPKPPSTNLNFVRVYCGPHNAAVVSHESLGAALIDRTNKPAIIFRIAAKNEKGYGPFTQVRWLQDSNVPGSNKNPSITREKSVNLLTEVPKRPRL